MIHSGSGLRLAFPHPAPRGAHGAAYVLSRRYRQDGSIHYSYCQASLLYCFAACDAGFLLLRLRFGSAPRPKINLPDRGKYRLDPS